MNQHIERLLESAPYTTISTEGRLFSQRDMARFAEALVKECADVIDQVQSEGGDFVRRHFGVEE
jgi:hypothetical protein